MNVARRKFVSRTLLIAFGLCLGVTALGQLEERWSLVLTNTTVRDYALGASGNTIIVDEPSWTDYSVALDSPITFQPPQNATPPLAYQWHHNGATLPGQTNRSLSIARAQLSDAGTYSVFISNAGGQVWQTRRLVVTASIQEHWRHLDPATCCGLEAGRHIVSSAGDLYVATSLRLRKFTSSGELAWTINGSVHAMISDGAGGVLAATVGGLKRYDSNGVLRYSQPATGTVLSTASNLIVVEPSFLRVYDQTAQLNYPIARACPGCSWNSVETILARPDGGFIVAGSVNDHRPTNEFAMAWVSASEPTNGFFKLGPADARFAFATTPDGGAIVCRLLGGDGDRPLQITSYSAQGQERWRVDTVASGISAGARIQTAVDEFGNVLVATDGSLIKYDAQGAELWRARSGHPTFGVQRPLVLRLNPNGEIYLLGLSPTLHMVLEKLNPEGNSLWVATLAQGFRDGPAGLEINADGTIHLSTGASTIGPGAIEGLTAKFVELNHPDAPGIVSNPGPAYIAITPGETATLSALAAGGEPLSYQWHYTQQSIAQTLYGETNATLSVAYPGVFFLEVRNAHGSITTRPVQVDVGLPPQFTLADDSAVPTSTFARVNSGGTVRLEVRDGWNVQGWQWFFNSAPIPGATNRSLTISNAAPAHAGLYTLRGTNRFDLADQSTELFVESNVSTVSTADAPGSFYNWPPHLAADQTSNLYFLRPGTNHSISFLSKYRPNGELAWTRQVGQYVFPTDLRVDAQQNVIVAGTGDYYRLPECRPTLVKFDPNGNVLWQGSMAGGFYRFSTAFCQGTAGDFFVTGMESHDDRQTELVYVAKFSAAGAVVWNKRLPGRHWYGNEYNENPAVVPAHDGGCYLASLRGLIRFNPAGDQLWTRGTNYTAVVIGAGGNIYATGPVGTAKYTPNGAQLWTIPKPGSRLLADNHGILLRWNQTERITPDGQTVLWSTVADSAMALGPGGNAYVASVTPYTLVTRALGLHGQELWQAKAFLRGYAVDLVVCPNGDVGVAHFNSGGFPNHGEYQVTRYRPNLAAESNTLQITTTAAEPVRVGSHFCFVSNVEHAPGRLAWFYNGRELPGETNKHLCVTADLPTEGTYTLALATDSRVFVSRQITLHLQRPYLYPLIIHGPYRYLTFLPTLNFTPVTVQRSTDLRTWHAITNLTPHPLLAAWVELPPPSSPAEFFRVVADP